MSFRRIPASIAIQFRNSCFDTLGDRLCTAWAEEVNRRSSQKKSPRMGRVLLRVFGLHLFVTGVLLGSKELLTRVTQPICLFGIMVYFTGTDTDLTKAYIYAAGLIAAAVLTVISGHPCMLGIQHLAMKMRVALCSMVYRKALRLSLTALSDTSIGQVVNLMSNDVGRFDSVLDNIHYLWLGPLELVIIAYIMYEKVNMKGFAMKYLIYPILHLIYLIETILDDDICFGLIPGLLSIALLIRIKIR